MLPARPGSFKQADTFQEGVWWDKREEGGWKSNDFFCVLRSEGGGHVYTKNPLGPFHEGKKTVKSRHHYQAAKLQEGVYTSVLFDTSVFYRSVHFTY